MSLLEQIIGANNRQSGVFLQRPIRNRLGINRRRIRTCRCDRCIPKNFCVFPCFTPFLILFLFALVVFLLGKVHLVTVLRIRWITTCAAFDICYSVQEVHITNGEVAQPQGNGDAIAASTEEQVAAIQAKLKGDLTYSIDEVPPWYNSILLGFQVCCKGKLHRKPKLSMFYMYVITGFFPWGGQGVPHPAKILPIPPSDTCPRFWTKACPPQPRFIPENLKNLNTFLCQIWLLLSSKVP